MAEIFRQSEAKKGFNKQLLCNYQTKDPSDHKVLEIETKNGVSF